MVGFELIRLFDIGSLLPKVISVGKNSYLQSVFGSRILSNKFEYIWPPYSPDLNPLDCWFWSVMRRGVGRYQPKTVEDVKVAVSSFCRKVDIEGIQRTLLNIYIRFDCLIQIDGAHFEWYLKEFKSNIPGTPSICNECHFVQTCSCPICIRRCDDSRQSREEHANFILDQDPLESINFLTFD